MIDLGNIAGQYQHYAFHGGNYAKTASLGAAFSGLGTKPACSIFAIVRASEASANQVLFAIGATGDGQALGLAIRNDNFIVPWLGTGDIGDDVSFENDPADVWRSIAVTWEGGTDVAKLYVNAALIGTEEGTRNFIVSPLGLGAMYDGSLPANPGDSMAHCDLAHVIITPGIVNTLAQIKALHNLLGYQYGLAIVA